MTALRAQILNSFSTLAIQLIQVPLLLTWLGPTKYGVFQLVIAIPLAMASLDFGLLGATATELTSLVSRRKFNQARTLAKGACTAICLLALTLVMISIPLSYLTLKSQTNDLGFDAIAIFSCWTAISILSLFTSLLEGFLRADGRFVFGWNYISALRILEFASFACWICFQHDLLAAGFLMLGVRLFGFTSLFLIVTRSTTWLSLRFSARSLGSVKSLLGPSFGTFLQPITMMFTSQGFILVIGVFGGPSQVPVFTSVKTITNSLRQLAQVLSSSTQPYLTRMISQGSGNVNAFFKRYLRQSFWIIVVSSLTLSFFGPYLFRIWTHNAAPISTYLFILFVLASLFENLFMTINTWFVASNTQLVGNLVLASLSAAAVFAAFATGRGSLWEIGVWNCLVYAAGLIFLTFWFRFQNRGSLH
jgi:O-antigen/teichoic acid export membrane protein